jgi:hypothetical protein
MSQTQYSSFKRAANYISEMMLIGSGQVAVKDIPTSLKIFVFVMNALKIPPLQIVCCFKEH